MSEQEFLGHCRHREGLTGKFRGGGDLGTCMSVALSHVSFCCVAAFTTQPSFILQCHRAVLDRILVSSFQLCPFSLREQEVCC